MSVIAVRREQTDKGFVWTMASDTQITMWNEATNIEHVKLFAVDDNFVIGTAGSAQEGAIVKMLANKVRPSRPDVDGMIEWMCAVNDTLTETVGEKSQNAYLIVFEGHAFFVDGFFIYEIEEYEAIGSGGVYARTALFLGATATEAVDVAIKFDIFCSTPTQLHVLEAACGTPTST